MKIIYNVDVYYYLFAICHKKWRNYYNNDKTLSPIEAIQSIILLDNIVITP